MKFICDDQFIVPGYLLLSKTNIWIYRYRSYTNGSIIGVRAKSSLFSYTNTDTAFVISDKIEYLNIIYSRLIFICILLCRIEEYDKTRQISTFNKIPYLKQIVTTNTYSFQRTSIQSKYLFWKIQSPTTTPFRCIHRRITTTSCRVNLSQHTEQ